jgi:hypothetical protein
VADVIHMIAELVENATIYSPPNTPVRVHGDVVGRGFAVEIEDRGLGISEEKMAEINNDFANPPLFDLSGSEQLGLFVAGQLAKRHDIRITLQGSPFGGTTAVVLLPKALVIDENADDNGVPALPTTPERPIRLASRHAGRNNGMIAEPVAFTRPSALMPPADPLPASSADLPAADLPPADVPAADWPAADWPPAGESPADVPPARDTRPFAVPNVPSIPGNGGDPGGPAVPAPPFGTAAPPSWGTPAPPAAEEESVFTPRRSRPAPATVSSVFSSDGEELQTRPDSSGAEDPRVDPAELARLGLPVRVRQASLAPQLRDRAPGADGADRVASAPSPEAARTIMTALQRGWERGRYISGSVTPPPSDTALNTESGGNGADEQSEQ